MILPLLGYIISIVLILNIPMTLDRMDVANQRQKSLKLKKKILHYDVMTRFKKKSFFEYFVLRE